MGVPMMVDSDWLAAVDAFVRANAEGLPAPTNAADSRFYDVRPIYVRTAWTWDDDDKFWKAKMNFVARDAPTNSVYDVCAPTFSSSDKPTASGRAFAVWRGRWELLDRPTVEYTGGDGISVDVANGVISNAGVLGVYVGDSPTAPASPPSLRTGKVCFSADDFKLDDLDNDSIGWRGVALKNPPKPWKFAAGSGVSVDVAIDSTVTIANTAPYGGVPISYYPSGTSMPQNGTLTKINVALNTTSSAIFSPETGTLTLRDPSAFVNVVTDVKLNSDGTLAVTKSAIYTKLALS